MNNDPIGTPNRGHDTYYNPNVNNQFDAGTQALLNTGAIQSTAGMYSGDGGDTGADMGYMINYDKLPQGQGPGGKPFNVAAMTPTNNTGSNLLNPSQRWKDPTYGNVSYTQNNHGYIHDGWDTLYNVLPSLFIAGMGGMALSGAGGGFFGPSNMMKIPQLAQSIGEGRFNPIGMAESYGMNALGVPSYLRPFIQYGLQQATNKGPRG
jgi:hypothetical protein